MWVTQFCTMIVSVELKLLSQFTSLHIALSLTKLSVLVLSTIRIQAGKLCPHVLVLLCPIIQFHPFHPWKHESIDK